MYGPVTQGEDFDFTGQMLDDSGAPLPAIASAFLVFAPILAEPAANHRFVATGAVVVNNVATAAYTYYPSPGDKASLLAGDWLVQATVTLAGGQVRYSTPAPLRVNLPL